MKLAFCILAHRVTPCLDLLVESLSRDPDFVLYLHVDSAVDIGPFAKYAGKCRLMEHRRRTAWASFGLVTAFLDMIRVALADSADHVFLLSGDDLPVRSNAAIKEFMATRLERQFIGISGLAQRRLKYRYPALFFQKTTGIGQKFLRSCCQALFSLGFFRNPAYKGIAYANKGCAWVSLSRAFAQYVLDGVDSGEIDTALYEHSLFPDESFFQNTVLHSPFRGTVNPTHGDSGLASLRYIDWESGPYYPRILDVSDIPKIRKSEVLFCRKVNPVCVAEFAASFNIG